MRNVTAIATVFLSATIACQTPSILTPADPPGSCHKNEHQCANGNCCLEDWTCGGVQPDMPVTCPEGECCDEENNPSLDGARRPQAQRRP